MTNLILPLFIMKCWYQDRIVSGHVYYATGINFDSFYNFSIVSWHFSDILVFSYFLFFFLICHPYINSTDTCL